MLIMLPFITNTHTVQPNHFLNVPNLLHVSYTEHALCKLSDVQFRKDSWELAWYVAQVTAQEVTRNDGHLK